MAKKGADMLIKKRCYFDKFVRANKMLICQNIYAKFQVLKCEKTMVKKGADSSAIKKKRCLFVRNLKRKGADSFKKWC